MLKYMITEEGAKEEQERKPGGNDVAAFQLRKLKALLYSKTCEYVLDGKTDLQHEIVILQDTLTAMKI